MTDAIPPEGSRCPGRIWPFKAHKFIHWEYKNPFPYCLKCGGKIDS